jgi:thiamine biosynthesis lipoprotein ApbE
MAAVTTEVVAVTVEAEEAVEAEAAATVVAVA